MKLSESLLLLLHLQL